MSDRTAFAAGVSRRYFVLSGGELKYFKTEKAAHVSNADSLKSIRLEHVLAATTNPKHTDMFMINLGMEQKVKLQAGSEAERDAWVKAIEAAKLKAWSTQEENAFHQVKVRPLSLRATPTMPGECVLIVSCAARFQLAQDARHSPPGAARGQPGTPAQPASSFGGGKSRDVRSTDVELLRTPTRKQGCCVIS
jgi:hypothetical protein